MKVSLRENCIWKIKRWGMPKAFIPQEIPLLQTRLLTCIKINSTDSCRIIPFRFDQNMLKHEKNNQLKSSVIIKTVR